MAVWAYEISLKSVENFQHEKRNIVQRISKQPCNTLFIINTNEN